MVSTRSLFWRATPVLLLGLMWLGGVPAAWAAGLSFEDAQRLAEQQAPELQARQAALDSATEAAVAADALPDPKAFAGIDNLPVEGPNRFSTSADFMTMQKIGVMQEFPNHGKREARAEAAQAGMAQQRAQLALARITVRSDVAAVWLTRYYLDQQLQVLAAQEKDNRLLAEAVRAQLAAGKGMAADALLPEQEAVALANRRDEIQRDIAMADATLSRWLALTPPLTLAGEPPVFVLDSEQLRQHLQHHPGLLLQKPMEDMARAELQEAEATRRPDWDVELAYQHRGPDFGDMLSFQVSADLPLFTGRRQDPRIRAQQKRLSSVEAESEVMRREHAATLEADIASATALSQQLTRLEQVALPLAQKKVELQMAAYRSGRGDLSAVLAARRERRDLDQQHLLLKNQQQALAARLHYLYLSGHAEDDHP